MLFVNHVSNSLAFDKCIEQGATRVICHPYFLSRGRHVRDDIPQLVAEAASANPLISYTITEPLGVQDGILDLIANSIRNSS